MNETANCGTISSMAKGFKNATLALALTAVGVVASCRASGASPDIIEDELAPSLVIAAPTGNRDDHSCLDLAVRHHLITCK